VAELVPPIAWDGLVLSDPLWRRRPSEPSVKFFAGCLTHGVGPWRVPPSDYNSARRAPLPTRMSKDKFLLSSVASGPYQLTVEAKGFQQSRQDVTIPARNHETRRDAVRSMH
jgi:hypothetical protein